MKQGRLIHHTLAIYAMAVPWPAGAQHAGHGVHPPMPGQSFTVQYRFEQDGQSVQLEAPLQLTSPSFPAQLTQVIELPAPHAPIRLLRYLPRAAMEQEIVVDETGQGTTALELSISGPTQSYRRWLVAGDPERNRLISFIGTWRYMVVEDKRQRDALFSQFDAELSRDPMLVIRRTDGAMVRELSARPGRVEQLEDLGCTVRVRSFHPHFAIDDKTNKPVNLSERRLNPAALVEVEYSDRKSERWVFARFPEFNTWADDAIPFRMSLDCPQEKERSTPDFVVLSVGLTTHEVWTRYEGKTKAKRVKLGKERKVPGSSYVFSLSQFVPSGRLVESYRPDEGRGAAPALKMETVDGKGKRTPVWLGLGKQRVISTKSGPIFVAFSPERSGSNSPVGVHK